MLNQSSPVARESRLVYMGYYPIVLAHGRARLTSDPKGATAYTDADARDSEVTSLKNVIGFQYHSLAYGRRQPPESGCYTITSFRFQVSWRQ